MCQNEPNGSFLLRRVILRQNRSRIDLARLDPDIQNWRKGQKWTLLQKLAHGFTPIFVPIARGALDKNSPDENPKKMKATKNGLGFASR
jgi:hypothetical protein